MNASESGFVAIAESKGYTVLRRGWPDFALMKEDGLLFCVEVKSGILSLSKEQENMIEFLALGGIPCYVSRDGDFPDLRKPEVKVDIDIPRYTRLIEREYYHRLEHVEELLRQIRKLCDE